MTNKIDSVMSLYSLISLLHKLGVKIPDVTEYEFIRDANFLYHKIADKLDSETTYP